MQELISLIIPVYNASKFLDETLTNAMNQDYKNIEIICVNDGSKDNSVDIIKKYQEKDKRIKLINQENQGPSVARNTGLDHANGEYIVFADSDDIITKDYISYLYNLLQTNTAKIASCSVKTFEDKPEIIEIPEELQVFVSSNQILRKFLENKDMSIVINATIYHKSIFETLRFKKYFIYEDMEILVRIFIKTNMLIHSNQVKYYYRQQENSIMHSSFSQKNIDSFKLLNEIEENLKKNAPAVLPEFYYYKLCVIGDQYKYLSYSNYENKNKIKKIIIEEYDKTQKEKYKKELVTTRQKVLWPLMKCPMPIYKLVVNTVRIIKGGF